MAEDAGDQVDVAHTGQAQLLQAGAGADEVLHELVRGIREDPLRGVVLDDPGSFVEDRDPVAEFHCLVEIVGHAHDGLVQFALDVDELVLEPLPGNRVDGAERFVHQENGRVGREGAGDADALLLPARELSRVAVAVRVRVQGDQVQQFVHALGDALLVPSEHLGDEADVARDGHVRQKTPGLDHVTDLSTQLVAVDLGDVLVAEDQSALRGLDQAVDHLEGRGLAAPGGADEHDDLPGRDFQGQLVDRGLLAAAVAFGHVLDEDRGALLARFSPAVRVVPGLVGRRRRLLGSDALGRGVGGGGVVSGVLRHGYPLKWSDGRRG